MGGITKEELLDVKNIELLKEIKGAFDYKIELERLNIYIRESRKLINFCNIERSEVFGCPKYNSTRLLVDIIEMMKKGKIIFKEE